MKKRKIVSIFAATVIIIVAVFLNIPNQEEIQETELSHSHFIADFDYMISAMEENFPFFGVTYRLLGFDIHELAAEVRASLINDPNMDGLSFYHYVSENFISHFEGLAHLGLLPFHHFQYFGLYSNFIDSSFFGDSDMNFINPSFEFEPLSIAFDLPIFERDIVETYIFEEGRIAYINFPTFSHIDIHFGWHSRLNSVVSNFIATLEGYEHLIVDIRETRGGLFHGFVDSIIKPNINEPFQDIGFAFHTGGRHASFISEAHRWFTVAHPGPLSAIYYLYYYPAEMNVSDIFQVTLRRFTVFASQFTSDMIDPDIGFGLTTATEIVERYNLIYINPNDLANLDYGFRTITHIRPNPTAPAFDGQIWLLTSPNNFSASEAAARFAKETGVAMLVGETTGGAIGGTSHIRLPNTSLILRWDTIYFTDRYGRSLEEYRTTPHFENRPGLDALETVLAIIEEKTTEM